MQVSPIEKPADHHHQSKAFQKLMATSKHKHYELLSFKEATALIYEREGVRGYFRGFFPSLLKSTFNSATYFSSLHYLRLALQRSTSLSENSVNFWASALARGIESTLANPLIVVKTRLEVLGFSEYAGLRDAF
jgi:Mitochondrial carrier protein